jgi:hypothetical protein
MSRVWSGTLQMFCSMLRSIFWRRASQGVEIYIGTFIQMQNNTYKGCLFPIKLSLKIRLFKNNLSCPNLPPHFLTAALDDVIHWIHIARIWNALISALWTFEFTHGHSANAGRQPNLHCRITQQEVLRTFSVRVDLAKSRVALPQHERKPFAFRLRGAWFLSYKV